MVVEIIRSNNTDKIRFKTVVRVVSLVRSLPTFRTEIPCFAYSEFSLKTFAPVKFVTLYRSIRKLMALPDETRLFMCHDYLPKEGRRHFAWETTVADERQRNVHAREGITEEDFVKMRTARDATLSAPTLLLPSIQVNMRAGKLPPADVNGVHYLRVPITLQP